jgi:hypothetical protein
MARGGESWQLSTEHFLSIVVPAGFCWVVHAIVLLINAVLRLLEEEESRTAIILRLIRDFSHSRATIDRK